MATDITVEVVFIAPDASFQKSVTVRAGTSVLEAAKASGVSAVYADQTLEEAPFGIFGKRVSKDQILKGGDRVEIYRPLIFDPKEARRKRAARAQDSR